MVDGYLSQACSRGTHAWDRRYRAVRGYSRTGYAADNTPLAVTQEDFLVECFFMIHDSRLNFLISGLSGNVRLKQEELHHDSSCDPSEHECAHSH